MVIFEGMESGTILAAIPIFFLLIAIEYLTGRALGREGYHFADSLNSLSCGVSQQVMGLLFKVWDVGVYIALYELLHLFVLREGLGVWILAFVLYDFFYYWFHRSSHRVNLIWAAHVVHHQSEEYNLTTALRQSALQSLFASVFFWPMALLGVHPVVYLTVRTFNTLYQFWIHTRLIKRLGPLEWVLNTPSHHRVHHGIDPKYIDKNHGGMFIVWDRLFSTFQEEEEEPNYGTVKPLMSWSPLWANLEGWARMVAVARSTERLRDKLGIFLRPPEWLPEDLGGPVVVPEVDPATRTKYRSDLSRGQVLYLALHFLVGAVGLLLLLGSATESPWDKSLVLGAWVLASVGSWGGLMEGRSWARMVETVRLMLLPWILLLAGEGLTELLSSFLPSAPALGRPALGLGLALAFVSLVWVQRGFKSKNSET